MAPRKAGRRRNRNGQEDYETNIMDKNQRFLMCKSVGYLQRYLDLQPPISAYLLSFTGWVIGEEKRKTLMNQLLNKVKSCHAPQDVAEQQIEDFDYVDVDCFAAEAHKMFKSISQVEQAKIKSLINRLLRSRIQELSYRGNSDLEKNLIRIQKMFDFSEMEEEFIILLFLATNRGFAERFFLDYLECNKISGRKALAHILQTTPLEVNRMLKGPMEALNVFQIDSCWFKLQDEFFELVQNCFGYEQKNGFFRKLTQKTIPLDCHQIAREETEYLLELLKHRPEGSTHILLYGPPGTGKSSYAACLTKKLKIPAYEVVRNDENSSMKRRTAILATINMTNVGTGSIILVDEADNLLNTQFSWILRGETQDKGWINKILEEPGIRMIWIVNHIENIEDSVLRRFAYSLHFKAFNKRQRVQVWDSVLKQNHLGKILSDTQKEELAQRYRLNAGVIDLAVKKAKDAGRLGNESFYSALKLALNSKETLFNRGEKVIDKNQIETGYSLDGLNIKGDLPVLINQLKEFDGRLRNSGGHTPINMNLLFYGPPGTGKSELARYIGKLLDREIICKRVSEIHNMYVGESEKNIRNTFAEAEREEAVLIFDEADSLLFSRDRAQHSWEISFTNEFLTQMERFRGILICTSNRMVDLDEASIRRFSFKVGFDYLVPDGIITFYNRMLLPLIPSPLDPSLEEALKGISPLAPGDFKVVRDRYSFYPTEKLNHQLFVNALKEEAQTKILHKGKKGSIGFSL